MERETPPTDVGQIPQAEQRSVALYPQDIETVKVLQRHFRLDSFSQAVRRCIRNTADAVVTEIDAKEQVA